MSADQQSEFIVLLANDALEAADNSHVHAALLLFNAGLSILVTRHPGTDARRELGSMFSEYVTQQIEAVITQGGDA
ncbi:hypothetical protein [Sphingomonas beigongshangi]|uniref:hypothetical protein n=1 Tax=Sphingomonas beigongshangi TaxID=2782540 RepID=UPI00193BA563|nr:hypothetical protein [Sphingomonas beigongshangi]